MSWSEYLELLMAQGSSFEIAQNTVGHLMDLYEDWEWDNKIPFDPDK